MTKMHQKLLKEIARRLRCFFLVHFRRPIYSLKIFEGGGLGAWPPIALPPDYTPLCRSHAVLIFDPLQCFYRAMHFSAKRGLAIALYR